MRINKTIAVSMAAMAASITTPAASADEPMTVEARLPHTERVDFGDLDLTTARDQRHLRVRVQQASDRVCVAAVGPIFAEDRGRPGRSNYGMTCADLTYAAAKPQIADAISRAKSEQWAVRDIILVAMVN